MERICPFALRPDMVNERTFMITVIGLTTVASALELWLIFAK